MPLPKQAPPFAQRRIGDHIYYTSDTPVNIEQVEDLVDDILVAFMDGTPKNIAWILSGTHGRYDGEIDFSGADVDFFKQDKKLENQLIKAVDVTGFTENTGGGIVAAKIVTHRWVNYLSKKLVILAWCYSNKSFDGWMNRLGVLPKA